MPEVGIQIFGRDSCLELPLPVGVGVFTASYERISLEDAVLSSTAGLFFVFCIVLSGEDALSSGFNAENMRPTP